MWHSGTWVSGGLGCVGFMIGLNDLRGLCQPKQFYDSCAHTFCCVCVSVLMVRCCITWNLVQTHLFWVCELGDWRQPHQLRSHIPYSFHNQPNVSGSVLGWPGRILALCSSCKVRMHLQGWLVKWKSRAGQALPNHLHVSCSSHGIQQCQNTGTAAWLPCQGPSPGPGTDPAHCSLWGYTPGVLRYSPCHEWMLIFPECAFCMETHMEVLRFLRTVFFSGYLWVSVNSCYIKMS